jgi:putative transposase
MLQHVMVRGIEKRDIFSDYRDRTEFVQRLSKLLVKTQTECLAWALIPNHFHLLLRPTKAKLSELMSRLLTGYAIYFNPRHRRCGHLFQNRYKSIVCEEECYFLELVRYIHLNPLRAGLVSSIENLDSYQWCGHAVVMGKRKLAGQATDPVLKMFDQLKLQAQKKYRSFVADGIDQGRRDELVGGGLKRHIKLSGPGAWEAYDERVLGSGEFVEHLWQEIEKPDHSGLPPDVNDVIGEVAAAFGI